MAILLAAGLATSGAPLFGRLVGATCAGRVLAATAFLARCAVGRVIRRFGLVLGHDTAPLSTFESGARLLRRTVRCVLWDRDPGRWLRGAAAGPHCSRARSSRS